MSQITEKSSVLTYSEFGNIGFRAGITLKTGDISGSDPYEMIKSDRLAGEKRLIVPRQVHGADILLIADDIQESGFTADALLSRDPGLCLTIRTADCLPLLMADPESGIYGAVHIGWRGLIGGILENLRATLKNLDTDLNRLYISLGPAIGECCFVVGAEVAVLFDEVYVRTDGDSHFLNIRQVVQDRLINMGVSRENIVDIGECTSCGAEKYYSFRRDGHAREQMVSFICKK